jgi:hypothetical protein
MEDEVFEVDESAVDPQRGAGVGEVRSLDPACTDRRAGDPLGQTRKGDAGVESWPHQNNQADFPEIVRH